MPIKNQSLVTAENRKIKNKFPPVLATIRGCGLSSSQLEWILLGLQITLFTTTRKS
jgi:hypothetical protein